MTETTCYYLSTTIDQDSNIYVAYWTNSSNQAIDPKYQIVILKIAANNQIKWKKSFPSYNSSGYGWAPSISVDSNKNVYFAFPTMGTIEGGTKSGSWDIAIYKLDSNGNLVWRKQDGTFNTLGVNIYPSIKCGFSDHRFPNGCVYLVYRTNSVFPGQGYSGGTDLVVVQLDHTGTVQWVRQNSSFNTSGQDSEPSIAVDSLNQVYIAYQTTGTVVGQTKTGLSDIVVFKMNRDGVTQWIRQNRIFNTFNYNQNPSIVVDANGNILVAYMTNGSIPEQTSHGLTDIVVFKLSNNGQCQWVKQQIAFNTSDYDDHPIISTDSNGNVYLAYNSYGTISGQVKTGYPSDIVLFKLNTDGQLQWVQQQPTFNTTGYNVNPSIQIDQQGNIFVAYPTNGGRSGDPYDIVVFRMLTSIESCPFCTCDSMGYLYQVYCTNEKKSDGQFDLIVCKKDYNGQTLWTQRGPEINTFKSNLNANMVSYHDGKNHLDYIYMVYQTSGEIPNGVSRFPFDIVVVKMTSNGQIIWSRQVPSFNTTRSDQNPSIDVEPYDEVTQQQGYIYVAYQTTGRCLGGYRSALKDRYDIVVFRLDSDGSVGQDANGQWIFTNGGWIVQSRYFNTMRGGRNPKIKYDPVTKSVYLAFTTDGRVYLQPFSGYSDICLVRLNQLGKILKIEYGSMAGKLWILEHPTFNTGGYDENPQIVTDPLGYLYLCYISGPKSPDSSITVLAPNEDCHIAGAGTSMGGSDLILCKIDPKTGTVIKSLQSPIMNTRFDESNPSMTYRNGFLYIAYQTYGQISGQVKSGLSDLVIVKVNCITFNIIWIRQSPQFNTSGYETHPSITTDQFGNCYVCYETTGTFVGQPFGSAYQAVVTVKLDNNGNFIWVRK